MFGCVIPRPPRSTSFRQVAKGLRQDAHQVHFQCPESVLLIDMKMLGDNPFFSWDYEKVSTEWAKVNLMHGLWNTALAAARDVSVLLPFTYVNVY